jgi:hypothetical protein
MSNKPMARKVLSKRTWVALLLVAGLIPIFAFAPEVKADTIYTGVITFQPNYVLTMYVDRSSPIPISGHWYIQVYREKVDLYTPYSKIIDYVDLVWASIDPNTYQGWKINNLHVYDMRNTDAWSSDPGTVTTGWLTVNQLVDYYPGVNVCVYNGQVQMGPYAGLEINGLVCDGMQIRIGAEFLFAAGPFWGFWSVNSIAWQFLTNRYYYGGSIIIGGLAGPP